MCEPEFEVDIKRYFRNRTPPNEGSTMTVLFDPADHSKVSVDPTSLVCAPPPAGMGVAPEVQDAGSELGNRLAKSEMPSAMDVLRTVHNTHNRWEARARSGFGAFDTPDPAPADPNLDPAQLRPGSVLSGDPTAMISQLSALHAAGKLSDADFEKAKRTLGA
jgi:hypothetical protein